MTAQTKPEPTGAEIVPLGQREPLPDAMMQHLLFDHPLLAGYAEEPNVALDWAGKVCAAHGLTVAQAAGRLAFAMDADAHAGEPSP